MSDVRSRTTLLRVLSYVNAVRYVHIILYISTRPGKRTDGDGTRLKRNKKKKKCHNNITKRLGALVRKKEMENSHRKCKLYYIIAYYIIFCWVRYIVFARRSHYRKTLYVCDSKSDSCGYDETLL